MQLPQKMQLQENFPRNITQPSSSRATGIKARGTFVHMKGVDLRFTEKSKTFVTIQNFSHREGCSIYINYSGSDTYNSSPLIYANFWKLDLN